MPNQYTYTKDSYNLIQLLDEVYSTINKQLYASSEGDVLDGHADGNGNQVIFTFNDPLSGPEEILLSGAVNSHTANPDYINTSILSSGEGLLPVLLDYYAYNQTYIGYGLENYCKIKQVITSGSSYMSLWASGNESLDKIWSARTSYSYF